VNIRIRLSRQTVKAMQARLHQAYDRGDLRLVRRISVLLEYLTHATPIATLRAYPKNRAVMIAQAK
jgi:hypothetical protein